MRFSPLVFISLFFLSSCQDSANQSNTVNSEKKAVEQVSNSFYLHEPAESGITFSNVISETEEVNHLEWDAVYYGGGVAIGDLNNDGLEDLFFCGNQVNDEIYWNKGDFKFEAGGAKAGVQIKNGWSNGVSMADVNGDGYLDIYVCRSGWKLDNVEPKSRKNLLYINQKDGSFKELAEEYGIANIGYSTQASFLDYDHDGDLDMFLLNAPSNNLTQKIKYATSNFPEFSSDRLYENNNGKSFTDVSEKSGVKAFSFGLGVVAADLNHDGWVDLYVANDYERPDYLYINQRDGTFKNKLNDLIKHTSFTAMGCDAADLNNDGFVDLTVLDMQSPDHQRSKTNMPSMQTDVFWSYVKKGYNYQYMSNVLQVNNGSGFFSDAAQIAGVSSTDWSWSVLSFDADHDGLKDLYVTNGINKDIRNNDFALSFQEKLDNGESISLFEMVDQTPETKLSNYCFRNKGDLEFEKITNSWNLAQESFSFGAAYGDLDNDGDLDLVVNNNNESPFLMENQVSKGNWLKVQANAGSMNSFGYGSKAIAFSDGEMQYQELSPVRGYQSSCAPEMHFGLGGTDRLDSLLIIFPDGTSILQENVKTNQSLQFNIAKAKKTGLNVYDFPEHHFVDYQQALGVDWTHEENKYSDFEREVLLPHKQSEHGPASAVADINGDGLEDVFVGGSAGKSSKFFIQNGEGKFSLLEGLKQDAKYEDVDAEFLDVDQDGDMDLLVVSGGYQWEPNDDLYAHRLYLNDGKGKFKRDSAFPKLKSNGKCVSISDWDNDGDIDVFIGSHAKPGKYPQNDPSFFLENTAGVFENVTESICKATLGMVTDAAWGDVTGNGVEDLVLVGEWMSPTVLELKDGSFENSSLTEGLENSVGWWWTVEIADVNGDGLQDLIAGNIGANNKFHPHEDHPLRIYGNDFDGNGTNDVVMSKMYKDKFVPVRGRECSSEQMPFVKEKFKNFESFSQAKIEEVLGEGMNDALFYEAKEFRSGIFINTGGGSFDFEPFGNFAQVSAIKAFKVEDFSGDGVVDILLAGNHYGAEVETARYDASNGLYLLGKGDGSFESRRFLESGFYAPGNVVDLEKINKTGIGKPILLVISNNGPIMSYVAVAN